VLDHKAIYVGVMTGALAVALYGFTTLPYDFLPKSDRVQFQIPVQLAPGTDSRLTLAKVKEVSGWRVIKKSTPKSRITLATSLTVGRASSLGSIPHCQHRTSRTLS
jgi:multidrug efflux pump subunit AcrB